MNRQLRRAQAKQNKKDDREKGRRRAARRARIASARQRRQRVRASRSEGRATGGEARSQERPKGRMPGRFAGILMGLTAAFIVLQAAVPLPDPTPVNSVLSAGFYLLFGYFMVLWLKRRGTERTFALALVFGAALAIGVEVGRLLRPEYAPDIITLALTLPLLVLGAFLGRLVFLFSP